MPRPVHLLTLALLLICATARSAPESPVAAGKATRSVCASEPPGAPLEQPVTRWRLQAVGHGAAYLHRQLAADAPPAIDLKSYTEQLDLLMEQSAPRYSLSF